MGKKKVLKNRADWIASAHPVYHKLSKKELNDPALQIYYDLIGHPEWLEQKGVQEEPKELDIPPKSSNSPPPPFSSTENKINVCILCGHFFTDEYCLCHYGLV